MPEVEVVQELVDGVARATGSDGEREQAVVLAGDVDDAASGSRRESRSPSMTAGRL
jgi:hypothetical protein